MYPTHHASPSIQPSPSCHARRPGKGTRPRVPRRLATLGQLTILVMALLAATPSLADISRNFDVGSGGSLWVEVEGASVQIDTGGEEVV